MKSLQNLINESNKAETKDYCTCFYFLLVEKYGSFTKESSKNNFAEEVREVSQSPVNKAIDNSVNRLAFDLFSDYKFVTDNVGTGDGLRKAIKKTCSDFIKTVDTLNSYKK